MQPVASPLTTTCARAAPLTPALRALRLVHVSPSSRHSPRGPALTAGILLWRARACQGNSTVARLGCNLERDFEWLLADAAHLQDREAEHITLSVHLLHDLIVGSLPEIARPLIEEHFEIVALRVVPNLHSVSGHSLHPASRCPSGRRSGRTHRPG